MRILIVHNILWAHYKASVFQALQRVVDKQPGVVLKVLQIARNERSRASLEATSDAATPVYSYEYELLFDRFLEDVSLRERTTKLLRRVRAFRPDVINLTGYYDPAQMLVLLWAKANGIRVVVQNESTAADHQRGGWKEEFKRWIIGRCDGFFCFGEQSAKYLIDLGVEPSKILLRKNAVDNQAIETAYDRALPARTEQQKALGVRPKNFVFVGRFITVKNLPTLLTSFAKPGINRPTLRTGG
jgi:glycosyltransferase involved in cell wall biosynthesis